MTGISKRALIFVIVLAVFGTHASADDGDPDLDGLPIVAIRVESSNIFDSFEPNTDRSEERRVGKEWRSRWSPYH